MPAQPPIKLEGKTHEKVESFAYLGSIAEKQGGTDANEKSESVWPVQLKEIWTSRYLSNNTKIRLFNSNIKSVLYVLYGAETWKTTVNTAKKIQTFINKCLRMILRTRWPDNIGNQELWQWTNQKSVHLEIRQRLEIDRPHST
jgi:hypothetical protein